MANRLNNKRAVESILVAKGDLALVNTVGTAIPSGVSVANQPIHNTTDGIVDLTDGQLSIVDARSYGQNVNDQALVVGDTVAESPEIRIYQGTATSGTTYGRGNYPLINNRPYEQSAPIAGRNSIIVTGKKSRQPAHSAWFVGDAVGNSAAINVLDETEYAINIVYRGRRMERRHSLHGFASYKPRFVTPDYTALGLTTANAIDHLTQNLGFDANRNSRDLGFTRPSFQPREPMVFLAVDSTGATGQDVAAIAVGSQLRVINTKFGLRGLTLTTELKASIIAALPAGAKVVIIDRATAGQGGGINLKDPSGVDYAPAITSGVADTFMVVALDEETPFVDLVSQVKIRLDVALLEGFNPDTVYHNQESFADEGEGTVRQWTNYYNRTAGQRKYNQYDTQDPVINTPIDLVDGVLYDSYIIEHYNSNQISSAEVSVSPQKTIILVPSTDTTTKTSLQSVLNPWTASVNASVIGPKTGGLLDLN